MDDEKRCTATAKRTGKRCARACLPGAEVCAMHGAAAPQVAAAAERRMQEQRAMALAQRSITGADLARFADPYAALEFCVGYSHALAQRLAAIVEAIPDSELRYHGRAGEQLRGEVTAMQRALDSLRGAAVDTLKLNLDARAAGIREQTAQMIEQALGAALQSSGCDLDGQSRARAEFRRNIRVAQR
jgi:hypothetical protein